MIFVPGPLRLVVFASTTALMLAIQLTGNFGFFNLLVFTLAVSLLDLQRWIGDVSPASIVSSPGTALLSLFVALWLIGGLIYFPLNSWVARGWLWWPALLTIRSRPLRAVFGVLRTVSGLRLLHAYGVFLPQASPAIKFVPVIEGSIDGGQTWHEYHYRYYPCTETSPPRAFAPLQPRWDHFVLYESFGLNPAGFISSSLGSFTPYNFSPTHRTRDSCSA